MGAKPGRCFSGAAARRDGLGTAIAATGATNRLAEVINGTKDHHDNEKVVPVNQPANAPATQSNTVSTSSPVVAEPAPTVIAIEPANPDVVYIPNYNPNVVYGSWANTAYPPVYLPPPAGEPFVDSFVRGFGYSMGVATTYALFSSIDWDDDDHDHHHHDDDDYHHHDGGHRDGNDWQHNGDNINIDVNNFNRITGEHLTDKNMAWRHNPNYRDGMPYHDQDMAKRFHQTDVKGGMSATPLPAPTRDSQRQAAASQFQQRTHAAPVITRDTQRQAAAQRFNEAEHNGSYDDFRDFSRRQPLTQQQKDAARQRYQSASPEQRQAAREKMQTNPQNQQRREAARQRIQSASPEQRQVFREKVQESRPQRLNDSNHTARLNNEQRSAARERLSERGARRLER